MMIGSFVSAFGRAPAPAATVGWAPAPVDMAGLTRDTRTAWYQLKAAALAELGLELRERSARRTCAQQEEQWEIGRLPGDTRQKVTYAQGCRSWHVLGRAVDFDPYRNGKIDMAGYQRVGELAERLGWKWGGRFPGFADVGHVEWHPGLKIEALCPDPTACVDIEPESDVIEAGVLRGRGAWLVGGLVLATAIGAGVAMARR